MLSVRPKVAELSFRVFGRSLHPELFEIYRMRRVERGNYQAKLEITSSGHVITWQAGRSTLTEVASSAQQLLPQTRRLLDHRLRGSRVNHLEYRGGIVYRNTVSLEPVTPDVFWTFQETLFAGGTPEGLLHNFDSSGRMALGAISYINVQTRLRSMRIRAIHTFPDDYAIVKSESTFAFEKE